MKIRAVLVSAVALLLLACVPVLGAGMNAPGGTGMDRNDLAATIVALVPPENFAGVYLDDGGQLVVRMKAGSTFDLAAALGEEAFALVDVQETSYALWELEAMKSALEPYMLEYGIATLDANEVTNTVDVELWPESQGVDALLSELPAIDPNAVRVRVLDEGASFQFPVAYAPPANP